MKKHRIKISDYNQFCDVKQTICTRSRSKAKSNIETIRIMSNKLPSDFFRPTTRELRNTDKLLNPHRELESGLNTPCFGEERKQSHSLSLFPNNKQKSQMAAERSQTLPVEAHVQIKPCQTQINIRESGLETDTRESAFDSKSKYDSRAEQFSHRHPRQNKLIRDVVQRYTEVQKIKYSRKGGIEKQLKVNLLKNTELQPKTRSNFKGQVVGQNISFLSNPVKDGNPRRFSKLPPLN